MAKKESQNQLTPKSNNFKEPLVKSDAEIEKKDENFRVPTTSSIRKAMKRRLSRHKKHAHSQIPEEKIRHLLDKVRKLRKRSRKAAVVEKASDKNIATLLRSERLLEFIKKGRKIPYDIAYNISKKTGFKSVSDLNDYISAHRTKFIVLVDKKEKHCQDESNKCNSLKRSDSVDLNLYFKHHFGASTENSATT